jgi:hypothetical protein
MSPEPYYRIEMKSADNLDIWPRKKLTLRTAAWSAVPSVFISGVAKAGPFPPLEMLSICLIAPVLGSETRKER